MPSPDSPAVPAWFEEGDPWLTDKMRQVAEIGAAEKELGPAIEKAVAVYLTAAHARVLRSLPSGRIAAAANLDDWPERDSVWRQAIEKFVWPVLRALFSRRFRREITVTVTITFTEVLDEYLDAVWARLSSWTDDVFAEIREAQHAGADDAAIADLLRIDAPSRSRAKAMAALQATIDDPSTKDSVRREARTRLAALRKSGDRSGMRWWAMIRELARTLALSALNAGTSAGAQAEAESTGEARFKQWWSAEDNRVRAAHILAHGQVQSTSDTFTVGGYPMNYPGDPAAPADLTVNCRCSLLTLSRAQATRQRAAYEASRSSRTDRAGRAIDDNGRVVATGQHTEGVSMESTVVPVAEVSDPVTEPYAEGPLLAAGREIPPEQTTMPWRGVLAPLDHRSPDGRVLAAPEDGAPLTRTMPLPLLYQRATGPGHDDAIIVGNITSAWIDTDANLLMGEGTFDLGNPDAREVVRQIDGGYHRWVSITHDPDASYTFAYFRGEDEVSADDIAVILPGGLCFDTDDNEILQVRTARGWRLSDATLVSTPAFDKAAIQLVDEDRDVNTVPAEEMPVAAAAAPSAAKRKSADASGAAMPGGRYPITNEADLSKAIKAVGRAGGDSGTEADRKEVRRHIMKRARALGKANLIPFNWAPDGSLRGGFEKKTKSSINEERPLAWCEQVADAVPLEPPAHWFADPELTGPVKVMVNEEGRVYGHIAAWKTEHAARPGIVPPPSADRIYGKFHRHPVRCQDGSRIKTGPLATSGHESINEPDVWKVMSHYDDPRYVVADVVCGEDEHGIWVSGALRAGVTPVQVMMADRYSFSGDWRGHELLAACAASVPGFHLDADDSVRALAASAAGGGALVADASPLMRIEDGEMVAVIGAGVLPPTARGQDATANVFTVTISPTPEEYGKRIFDSWKAAQDADVAEQAEALRQAQRAGEVEEFTARVHARRQSEVDRLRRRVESRKKVGA